MGIDAAYQALPDDSTLVRTAKEDADTGWCLDMVYYEFWHHARHAEGDTPRRHPARRRDRRRASTTERGGSPGSVCAKYQALVHRLILDHPGIETRNYSSRLWDVLHYLLSHHRRRATGPYVYGDDMGSLMIQGSENVAPHLVGGQVGGGATRYLPSGSVRAVAAWVEDLQLEETRRRLIPLS